MVDYLDLLCREEPVLRRSKDCDDEQIRRIKEIMKSLTVAPALNISAPSVNLDEALSNALAVAAKVTEWEYELVMRDSACKWLLYRCAVYERTNGRERSVHGKRVAAYLLKRASQKGCPIRDELLKESQAVSALADKVAAEKERVHCSAPI